MLESENRTESFIKDFSNKMQSKRENEMHLDKRNSLKRETKAFVMVEYSLSLFYLISILLGFYMSHTAVEIRKTISP